MIAAYDLKKSFRHVEAVRGVSFEIKEKQVVGLLGPNGAGKTTTMRMLTTYLPPSSGTAQIEGFDILKNPNEARKNLGYLPENPPLYPELRVQEYLRYVAKLKGVSSRQLQSRIDEMLERCALTEMRNRVCSQLSKGYRQRVGIAQAIIHNPKVIILDEPTSGLDPAQIIEIRKLIRALGAEHTVILSTHILQEVMETCSRVLIVAQGQIVVDGSIDELVSEKSLEQRFLDAVSFEKVETTSAEA